MSLRQKNVLSVIVLFALAALAVLGIYKALFPSPGGYEVTAEFRDAGGITKNSEVKIGGIAGGTVEEIELTGRDTALLTFRLDDGAGPIGAGAVARSRPVNLLGEKFIDLDPGDLERPQPSGARIPVARTSRPVELDDVLNTLQPDVRARMRVLINEAGISMEGRGADFNQMLDNLPPALDETRSFVADFSRDNGRLKSLIDRSDRVIRSFARERGDLQDLVSEAADTLAITADKRREVAATLTQAPGSLRQLRTSLTTLGGTATKLEPAARELRAAAPQLTQALTALPAFAKDAAPALGRAEEVAPSLTRLGVQARPTVQRLRPTMADLTTFSEKATPLVKTLDDDSGMGLILGVMNGWASATGRQDGLSKVFVTRLVVDDDGLTNIIDRYTEGYTKPTAKKRDAKPAPAAPRSPSAQAPEKKRLVPELPKVKLPKLPALPLPGQVKKKVDDVAGTVDSTVGRLAGPKKDAAPGQGPTSKLFDYLFGP